MSDSHDLVLSKAADLSPLPCTGGTADYIARWPYKSWRQSRLMDFFSHLKEIQWPVRCRKRPQGNLYYKYRQTPRTSALCFAILLASLASPASQVSSKWSPGKGWSRQSLPNTRSAPQVSHSPSRLCLARLRFQSSCRRSRTPLKEPSLGGYVCLVALCSGCAALIYGYTARMRRPGEQVCGTKQCVRCTLRDVGWFHSRYGHKQRSVVCVLQRFVKATLG